MSAPVFAEPEFRSGEVSRYAGGMERLVSVVQELSLARDLPSLMTLVKRAARELTGADGATFVLRDGPYSYYADEDAIGPLWKGKRFPLETCISGWSMLHRQAAIIEDIYVDPRIPTDAYAPTFVKSLVMVPIRTVSPVGAIGNYWVRKRLASPEEVKLGRTTLRADEELLRRVLQNLTDNALRHNPPGGTVQLLAREGEAGEVELRVLDQGPGIPAEMRQAIFDKYKRLAPGRDERTLCGRGLGLTFCKLAVQGHGGSIAVEANPPRGSAFIVRLPRGR